MKKVLTKFILILFVSVNVFNFKMIDLDIVQATSDDIPYIYYPYISAGGTHSLVRLPNGDVYGAGRNEEGQLMYGPATGTSSFVLINTGIIAVSAGGMHSLMIDKDYAIIATGSNIDFQSNITQPKQSNVGGKKIMNISAGNKYSLFLDEYKNIWAIGDNSFGQLGSGMSLGTSVSTLTLVNPADGILQNIKSISAGYYHSLFLNTGTQVIGAGYNTNKQMGDFSSGDTSVINELSDLNIVKVSAGERHSLFLSSSGSVYSVGNNTYGQLGTNVGFADNINSGIDIIQSVPINSIITSISVGRDHSLFLTNTGLVLSVGSNYSGQRGIESSINSGYVIIPINLPAPAVEISAGSGYSLFLLESGDIYGVGDNSFGQLGIGNNICQYIPQKVTNIKVPFIKILSPQTKILSTQNPIFQFLTITGSTVNYSDSSNNNYVISVYSGSQVDEDNIVWRYVFPARYLTGGDTISMRYGQDFIKGDLKIGSRTYLDQQYLNSGSIYTYQILAYTGDIIGNEIRTANILMTSPAYTFKVGGGKLIHYTYAYPINNNEIVIEFNEDVLSYSGVTIAPPPNVPSINIQNTFVENDINIGKKRLHIITSQLLQPNMQYVVNIQNVQSYPNTIYTPMPIYFKSLASTTTAGTCPTNTISVFNIQPKYIPRGSNNIALDIYGCFSGIDINNANIGFSYDAYSGINILSKALDSTKTKMQLNINVNIAETTTWKYLYIGNYMHYNAIKIEDSYINVNMPYLSSSGTDIYIPFSDEISGVGGFSGKIIVYSGNTILNYLTGGIVNWMHNTENFGISSGNTVKLKYNYPLSAGAYSILFTGSIISANDPNKKVANQIINFFYGGVGGSASIDLPKVEFTYPSHLATNVPIDSIITIQFSQPINISNINSGTITISDGINNIYGRWIPSNSNTTLIGSGFNLIKGKTYILHISKDIKTAINQLIQGNKGYGMGHEVIFTTMLDYSSMGITIQKLSIRGSSPFAGAFNVSTNAKMLIEFSDQIKSDTINNNIKLFKCNTSISCTEEITNITKNLDKMTQKIVIISGSTLLTNGKYSLRVYGGIRSIYNAPSWSDNTNTVIYSADFEVKGTSNTQIQQPWSFPYDGSDNIDPAIPSIDVGFDRPIDPDSINASAISVFANGAYIATNIEYDVPANTIKIKPINKLPTNSNIKVTINTGSNSIRDLAGNTLAQPFEFDFFTSGIDNTPPNVDFAVVDRYAAYIRFSENMNTSSEADFTKYPNSVLNKSNYILRINSGSYPTNWDSISSINLSNTLVTWDSSLNGVSIFGLNIDTSAPQYYYLQIKNLSDVSGNVMTYTGEFFGTVMDDFMSTISGIGGGSFDPTGMIDLLNQSAIFDAFAISSAFPENPTANVSTRYTIDIAIKKQLFSGNIIDLIFPSGFVLKDVSKYVYESGYDPNTNINGLNDGSPSFDIISKSGSIIRLKITGNTSQKNNDNLHIELDKIKNTSIPREFGTNGYNVNIKTYSGNKLIESINTIPFFIQPIGTNKIDVELRTNTGLLLELNGVKIYANGPYGKIDTQTTIKGSTGFTALSDGYYSFYTDSMFNISGTEYAGDPMPKSIYVSDGSNQKVVLNVKEITGSSDIKILTGYIAISGNAGDKVVIWASSLDNPKYIERIETLGANGTGYTLKLDIGRWNVGVYKYVPSNFMSILSSINDDWIIPQPREVNIKDDVGNVDFNINKADRDLIIYVLDGTSSGGIVDANVWAYNPSGSTKGGYSKTTSDGSAKMKLADGVYNVGVSVPGMSMLSEKVVNINGTGQTIYFYTKLKNVSIEGKVLDGTKPIQNAAVYAYNSTTFTYLNTFTDSAGNYKFFVEPGSTWKIGAYVNGYGNIDEITVNVNNISLTNQNLRIPQDEIAIITGAVMINNNPIKNAFIWVEGSGSTIGGNSAITDTLGLYNIKVKSGSYVIRAYDVTNGDLGTVSINAQGGNYKVDFIKNDAPGTLSLIISGNTVIEQLFVSATDQNGKGISRKITNTTGATLSLLPSTYTINISMSIYGKYVLSNIVITSGQTNTQIINLPQPINVSGIIKDTTTGTGISSVFIKITDIQSGYHTYGYTTSTGAFNIPVQLVNNNTTTYQLTLSKQGYITPPPYEFTTSGNIVIPDNTLSMLSEYDNSIANISGYVYIGSNTGSNNVNIWGKTASGDWVFTKIDVDGKYNIKLTKNKVWTLEASADGYTGARVLGNVTNDMQNQNIILNSISGYIKKLKVATITPANGGVIEDTNMGLKLNFQAGSLGNSTNAGKIIASSTTSVPVTPTNKPLNNQGKEINAFDSNGNSINNLNTYIDIEMTYTKDQLIAGGITSLTGTGGVENLKLAYWDDIKKSWVYLHTTIVYNPTNATWENLQSVTLKASTNHFTVFSALLSQALTAIGGGSSGGGGSGSGGGSSGGSSSTTSSSGGGGGGTNQNIVSALQEYLKTEIQQFFKDTVQKIATTTGVRLEEALSIRRNGKVVTLKDIAKNISDVLNNITSLVVNFAVGDVLSTTNKSGVEISLSNYTDVRMDPNSQIKIGDVDKDLIAYDHDAGNVWYKFKQRTDKSMRYKVSTSNTVAIVKGTQLNVKKLPNGDEQITLIEGAMEVYDKKSKKTYNIEVGQTYVSKADGTVSVLKNDITPQVVQNCMSSVFCDVDENSWYYPYVKELKAKGIIKGKTDSTFEPASNITRAEALKIALLLNKSVNITDTKEKCFEDIEGFEWYTPYVCYAKKHNIVSGFSDNTFKPNNFVTRAEALKMLATANNVQLPSIYTEKYLDVNASDWYVLYIQWSTQNGITKGYSDGKFKPNQNINRAEFAKIANLMIGLISKY